MALVGPLVGPAVAGEWEDCLGPVSDRIATACSAVLDRNDRGAPDLAKARLRRGIDHRNHARLDQALADFEAATALDPASSEAFFLTGSIYRQKGDIDRAADCSGARR